MLMAASVHMESGGSPSSCHEERVVLGTIASIEASFVTSSPIASNIAAHSLRYFTLSGYFVVNNYYCKEAESKYECFDMINHYDLYPSGWLFV